MKLILNSTTYTKLSNVHFAPECDITCASLPINEFSADIKSDTAPSFTPPGFVELRDEQNTLFAKYQIESILNIAPGLYRLRAVSPLRFLEKIKVPAVMYSAATVSTELSRLLDLGMFGTGAYSIDSAVGSRTFSGFCPEQSVRDRVLHICLATGIFIRSFGSDKLQVIDWDETVSIIQLEDTYWRPEPSFRDHLDAVKAKAYTFTEGTPQQGDTSVEASGHTYIVTAQESILSKMPNSSGITDNAVDVSQCMLINSNNVDDVLSRLSKYYFYSLQVSAAILNNGAYWPGDKLTVPTAVDKLTTGYAQRMDFSFGVQAKAALTLVGCTSAAAVKLTVKYVWDGINLGKKVYYFPVNYAYSVANPFLDKTMNKHRYIFRPTTASVTGTLTEATTVTVQYSVALDAYKNEQGKRILHVLSVDSLTESTVGEAAVLAIG